MSRVLGKIFIVQIAQISFENFGGVTYWQNSGLDKRRRPADLVSPFPKAKIKGHF